MDSFELNKVAGAVLGTLLLAMGSGFVAELIYSPKPAGSAGYALPEPQPEAAGGGAAAAAKVEPLPVRLASASVEKGTGAAKKCAACHSFEKGGPNKVGPHLWGVVDRQRAHEGGFEYSAALKEKGGTLDLTTTLEPLPRQSEDLRARHQDGLRRDPGSAGARRCDRLPAFARRYAGAPLPAVEKAAAADSPAGDKPADQKAPEEKPAQ